MHLSTYSAVRYLTVCISSVYPACPSVSRRLRNERPAPLPPRHGDRAATAPRLTCVQAAVAVGAGTHKRSIPDGAAPKTPVAPAGGASGTPERSAQPGSGDASGMVAPL